MVHVYNHVQLPQPVASFTDLYSNPIQIGSKWEPHSKLNGCNTLCHFKSVFFMRLSCQIGSNFWSEVTTTKATLWGQKAFFIYLFFFNYEFKRWVSWNSYYSFSFHQGYVGVGAPTCPRFHEFKKREKDERANLCFKSWFKHSWKKKTKGSISVVDLLKL